jgi:hypothetical protein
MKFEKMRNSKKMITKKIKHEIKMVTALSSRSLKPRLGEGQSFFNLKYYYPFISPFNSEFEFLAFPPFSPLELNLAMDQPQPPSSHQMSFKILREYALRMQNNQRLDCNILKVKNNKNLIHHNKSYLKDQSL